MTVTAHIELFDDNFFTTIFNLCSLCQQLSLNLLTNLCL